MKQRKKLQISGKECVPIVIGGMGVDISTANLALVAASLGGVGHISDAMVPYLADKYFGTRFQHDKSERFAQFRDREDKEGVSWDPAEIEAAQRLYVEKTMAQKKGTGGIFINIMEKLTMGNPKPTLAARVRAAMDGGIDGITLSAGLHLGTLSLVQDHSRFRDVQFGIIVSSARALKLFCQAARKVDRLPDYVVVEGPLAGGHLGFGQDWREHQLPVIVDDVLRFLDEAGLSIPVVPAGGIFSSEDARAYLEMGAAAVQVATRFVVSNECGLPEPVKHEYLRAKEEDVIVNMTSPAGYPMRMLRSSPSLRSNIRPNCEALGYMLDSKGQCSYREAYRNAGVDERGKQLPVTEKMCICHHFMKQQCYTCGHNVFRLKDVVKRNENGDYVLPPAAEIFADYARLM